MHLQSINLSDDLRAVIDHAQKEAARRHGVYVDNEHLMLGLLRQKSGPAYLLFSQYQVDTHALYNKVAASVGVDRPNPVTPKGFSRWAKTALEHAVQEAAALGQPVTNSGHLLLALLAEEDGIVPEVLSSTRLTADQVRSLLRSQGSASTAAGSPFSTSAPQSSQSAQREPQILPFRPRANKGDSPFVLRPMRQQKARPRTSSSAQLPSWLAWVADRPWLALILLAVLVYVIFIMSSKVLFTFVFVFVGWIFSLTLHEFAHALIAYLGGDYTVRNKGYLTFNPLRYTHPVLSIYMPLIFLALGGIGLPGGAVYIEHDRLRSRWWRAAVSAAGPAANLLFALVLALPFILGLVDIDIVTNKIAADYFGYDYQGPSGFWNNATLWSAWAFLIVLEISATLFNLLPIPPFDGFGILEPFLDPRTVQQMRAFGMYGILIVFMLFWMIEPINNAFWDQVYDVSDQLSVPGWLSSEGYDNFMFWRIDNE